MTDSALSSLFPTNQIGADGFNWFIGQIESGRGEDPKGSGRHRVRIVGHHPKSCNMVKTEDLGWAQTMMPVTNPHTPGGAHSISDQLESGTWVVGFFLDPDRQMPMIMGSIGRVANSFTEDESEDEDPTPGEDKCKEFTTFVKPKNKIIFDQFPDTTELDTVAAGHAADGTERPEPKDTSTEATSEATSTEDTGEATSTEATSEATSTEATSEATSKISGATNHIIAKYSQNTGTNPTGANWCLGMADKCGKETDLSNTFTRLFAEMLAETQNNDGKLGTYLVGQLTGEMTNQIEVGRKYVTQAVQVTRTFIANVKGFVVEQMRAGVKLLTDALIYPNKTGNSLTPVTKFFNDMLANIGCEMADLGDRLAKFIEDIIFGYLFNIYKQTACHVDTFVNGMLNKIQSLMNDLLNSVLGPISDILGAVASAFNIIGDSINYVLSLLGITCSGPGKKCSKTTVSCTDCAGDKREDFLDRLLNDLEQWGVEPDWAQYVCEDAYEGRPIPKTDITFVGGIQNPPANPYIAYSIDDIKVKEGNIAEFTVRRAGVTDIISSVSFNTRPGTAVTDVDFQYTSGILGFVEGEVEKKILVRTFSDTEVEKDEDFFVIIFKHTPSTISSVAEQNIGRCVITKQSALPEPIEGGGFEGDDPTYYPTIPALNPNNPDNFPNTEDPEAANGSPDDDELDAGRELIQSYSVTPDKTSVKEGEFITYSIEAKNVPDGAVLKYQLFGENITPSDIVGFTLSGKFVVNSEKSTVIVGINEDNNIENSENLIFAIPGTAAQATVIILSDTESFNKEDQYAADDSSSDVPPFVETELPIAGSPITDPGGGIIDIPIENTGDPYQEAPAVFVTGYGHGAAAIALLDSNGYLSEVRVTSPGFGYKLNTPENAEKECIIDSFTMLRPGKEYTSVPTVYVNGDPAIAEALINSKGQVISVRTRNREMVFTSYPEVLIVGGGGYAAKFIPSFICLDPDARVDLGSAKIGTGSYIDCP